MFQFSFLEFGLGQVRIDDFVESFECDHSYWSEKDYEAQWKGARRRLDKGLAAMFFTSISQPDSANFFRTWICYPIEEELIFHEWIMFMEHLDQPVAVPVEAESRRAEKHK